VALHTEGSVQETWAFQRGDGPANQRGNSSMKRKIRVTATDLCSGAGEASSMQLSLDH